MLNGQIKAGLRKNQVKKLTLTGKQLSQVNISHLTHVNLNKTNIMCIISYTLSKHEISISTAHRGYIFNINVFILSRNVYRKIEVTRQVAPLKSGLSPP